MKACTSFRRIGLGIQSRCDYCWLMTWENKKPIVYEGEFPVRFADLDPYGHVNASHYLDYVASVRMHFLEEKMKMPPAKIVEQGVAFYLRKATQTFKKPINGIGTVYQRSHVERVEGALLVIPYELRDQKREILYSDGILEYAVVNVKTMKPVPPPDWVLDLFFA